MSRHQVQKGYCVRAAVAAGPGVAVWVAMTGVGVQGQVHSGALAQGCLGALQQDFSARQRQDGSWVPA